MIEVRSFPIFPTLISYGENKNYSEIKDTLLSEVDKIKNNDPKGVEHSNFGGWQSHSNIGDEIKETVKYAKNCINESLSEFMSPNFDLKYYIENIWINVNKPGDANDLHDHPGSDFSVIFWLKTPKDCGNLLFTHPEDFAQYTSINTMREEYKEALNIYPSYYFTPKEGSFLVFPSSLMHKVEQNKSNEDRISVACNIKIVS